MLVTKYDINNSKLSLMAAFIWHLTSEADIAEGRLLPVVNTDLIINLSAPITYRFFEGENEQAPRVHIRYVKRKPQIINQAAKIDVWGVSLNPCGVYPILRKNLSLFKESIIDLKQINSSFCTNVLNGLRNINESCEGPAVIEEALMDWIGDGINMNEIRQVNDFIRNDEGYKIGDYCRNKGIGIKSLERLIKKYTGFTPKQLHLVARFQRAGNDIIYGSEPPSLAELAYSHDYFDQTHMTREFKEYAGTTPFSFLSVHDSIKEKMIE
jgi:AraC-like DNA-binding protein